MDLMTQQIKNEYTHSKAHMRVTFQDEYRAAGLLPSVHTLLKMVRHHFANGIFTYVINSGEVRTWDTKIVRYDAMCSMDDDDLEELVWTLVIAGTRQATCSIQQMVGQLIGAIPHEGRLALETAGELVGLLAQTPFITVKYPRDTVEGVIMIRSNIPHTKALDDYLEQRRFILPSLVLPRRVTHNHENGYQTFNATIFTKGKHHDYRVNLTHINRLNAIPLTLDTRLYARAEPVYVPPDLTKVRKKPLDPVKHYKQWVRMNTECVHLYAELGNYVFYITHQFDERLRTYTHAFHFNLQGQDYQRAGLELANKELCS